MESNYNKPASVYTMLSTKLKFDKYIVDHCSLYCINFGVSRIHSSESDRLRPIGPKHLFYFSIDKFLEFVQN